ncbi:MAG: Ig-like domain-containing protein [Lachnospiraceae bacterium]|nr:Ig-like domain-containing protein [Lachnospiraceae bacterium]
MGNPQTVDFGNSANAPADPKRKGYIFTGWDTSFSNVKQNLVVTATYKPILVSKITVNGEITKLAVGKSVLLKADVTPADALNTDVVWSSSNDKYATVTAAGKVTAKKTGAGKTVTITATAKDGSGKKAVFHIKIYKSAVKKIKLSAKSKSVKPGKKVTIKAKVSPSKGINKTLKWSSSNEKYATVNSKGVVTTKKAGKGKTVTITAKATDGSNKKATIKIKIKKK